MSEALSGLNAHQINDVPIEYVRECTNNFHYKLGQGGGGEVFLATDKENPYIKYVAKRIQAVKIQEGKIDSFRRELEVNTHD